MNDAGAISEAVTREIVVENGQITGYRRCCADSGCDSYPVSAFRPGLFRGGKGSSAVSAGADLTEEDYTVNYT